MMKRVATGVYQIESPTAANAYLIESPADLTLVDAGAAEGTEALLGELRDNGFDFNKVGRIVMTNAYPDHAGGLKALLARHRVRVYAHADEVPALLGKAPVQPGGLLGKLSGRWAVKAIEFAPPETVVPLDSSGALRGLPQWQVVHTPGHTPGSLSLYNPVSQILICGDALGNQGGKLQLPATGAPEAKDTAFRSAKTLAGLDPDILCCGHGPVLRGGAFRFIEQLLKETGEGKG